MNGICIGACKLHTTSALLLVFENISHLVLDAVVNDNRVVFATRYEMLAVRGKVGTVYFVGVVFKHVSDSETADDARHLYGNLLYDCMKRPTIRRRILLQ